MHVTCGELFDKKYFSSNKREIEYYYAGKDKLDG